MKIPLHRKQQGWLLGVVSLVFVFAAGCTLHRAYLVPAPTDNLTNGGRAVAATADGVSITVTPNAWNGAPRDLYDLITPLKVRIENNSKRPIRVTYEDFVLRTSGGTTLAALPPSEVKGERYGENWATSGAHIADAAWKDPGYGDRDHDIDRGGTTVILTPGFDYDDFYYAPYWGFGYSGIGPWPYGWAPDMGYYYTYYPYMRAVRLPTRSMLRKGIPEGVIAPGGYVKGFLYFEKVSPNLARVNFVAKLQGAHSGRVFGVLRIPFTVTSR
jgi:hypothetical protein